jgi:hypothetical protein
MTRPLPKTLGARAAGQLPRDRRLLSAWCRLSLGFAVQYRSVEATIHDGSRPGLAPGAKGKPTATASTENAAPPGLAAPPGIRRADGQILAQGHIGAK